ncbi:50S ribosomal protein L18 [Candidatus Curtissbacteria bacterium]|nr:50S ribosomal protein L18 [Candidatus Curtissbacteria bacterium]
MKNVKLSHRKIRHQRLRKKITGNSQVPRLVVFRSNKHIYAQIIDDTQGKTLIATTDLSKPKKVGKITKIEKSFQAGENLAKAAIKKNIKKVVFDRAGYHFHGRVKSLAEGARKGGLLF